MKSIKRIIIIPLFLLCLFGVVTLAVRSFTSLPQHYKAIGLCAKNPQSYDPHNKSQAGKLAIGLATSGGGSRAAYLTAAVFKEIHSQKIRLDQNQQEDTSSNLLDQIDYVSSVSGSALATAYYFRNSKALEAGASGDEKWNDYLSKMAQNYRKRQWYSDLFKSPDLWWKFAFTNYNRGSLARDDYDETLFNGATLADLPDRPTLYINAFDVGNSVRFIFSNQPVNTTYFQPRDWWGKLSAPQDFENANDLTFLKVDPKSVRLADAVYASSAFPLAYPNMAIKHCGQKILYQGGLVFLTDGGLGDNSGLITLLTQMKAEISDQLDQTAVLALNIDASLNRIDTNGSSYQRRDIEDTYAWNNTVFGHTRESITSSVARTQDLGWKFLQRSGVVTDQISLNWKIDLTRRTGKCGPSDKTSWINDFETGKLALRPLIIRIGLRDVLEPNFLSNFLRSRKDDKHFSQMLLANGLTPKLAEFSKRFKDLLLGIETDFVLTEQSSKALDLAAYMLVSGKLKPDLAVWQTIVKGVSDNPATELDCQK